jgi:3-hydroxymyristoyl/3-hydroxydecanoyl-(acyl carrier protein) dehydratase
MNEIDRLPHRPPMRLLEEIVELVPGARCVARRRTCADDFYFQGHFPGSPIVPASMLVELIAQTGGLAAGTAISSGPEPIQLRVAAFGPCKFPASAGADLALEIDARVIGQMGGLYKIQGEVRAAGTLVATGEVTLAYVPAR